MSSDSSDQLNAVQEPDEDDAPPSLTRPPFAIRDTLRILKPEEPLKVGEDSPPEIKGTFVKTGDPKPVVPVQDENRHYGKFMDGEVPKKALTPRKRLVLDDDEEVV